MKAKEVDDNPDTVKQRLKAFLEPTGAMGRNEKPTITAWCANSFKMLKDSMLFWCPRMQSKDDEEGISLVVQCLLSTAICFGTI